MGNDSSWIEIKSIRNDVGSGFGGIRNCVVHWTEWKKGPKSIIERGNFDCTKQLLRSIVYYSCSINWISICEMCVLNYTRCIWRLSDRTIVMRYAFWTWEQLFLFFSQFSNEMTVSHKLSRKTLLWREKCFSSNFGVMIGNLLRIIKEKIFITFTRHLDNNLNQTVWWPIKFDSYHWPTLCAKLYFGQLWIYVINRLTGYAPVLIKPFKNRRFYNSSYH